MRVCALLCLVFMAASGMAQTTLYDDYYPYAEPEERAVVPHSDSVLFYRALRSRQDLYDAHTRFALPRVSIARRGESYRAERASLLGVTVSYASQNLLRLLGATELSVGGASMVPASVGSTGGQREFRFTDDLPLLPYRVSARYAERNYRAGVQAVYDGELAAGWHGGWAIDCRTGRDARIEGVFTNALQVGGRLSKQWSSGRELTLVAAMPLSMRGLRSASTEEAFQLTDDHYYNPSWGFQDGKVRNARVRREWLPMMVAAFHTPISLQSEVCLTVGAEMGVRKQSGLGWYNARTPQPDHYRKMPSYAQDPESDAVWRNADPRYTQVAWDELIEINRMGEGMATYALEDRVERLSRMQFRVAFTTRLDAITLDYGLFGSYHRSRHYKEMRDLLGAEYLIDIDQYLVDDDTYFNRLQNDLRHPSRHISKGDRFAYDYALHRGVSGGWLHLCYEKERWKADAALEVTEETIYRKGYYEKELFPANGSFGASRKVRRRPFVVKGLLGRSLSPRQYLQFSLAYGKEMPDAANLFIQPQYNNRVVTNPTLGTFLTSELQYRQRSEQWDWQASAFFHLHCDGLQTMRYFDDLSATFADMTVSGLATRAVGVEFAAAWRLSYRWSWTFAASVGDYRYVEDAQVDVVADTDNHTVDGGAVSHLRNCRPGSVPAITAATSVRYYGRRGWSLHLSAGVAVNRYVDPAALRRTDRVAHQAGSTPESFAAFTHQKRLQDAFTLDVSVYKTFYMQNDTQLQCALHLNNLLGLEVPSYGFESMRMQRQGSSAASIYMPQATRYLYAAPRSIQLTVGYRF